MTLLVAQSKAARQIIRALNLPKNTVAFTLRLRVGEAAILEVETYVEQNAGCELATVLTGYRLEALDDVRAEAEHTAPLKPNTEVTAGRRGLSLPARG